MALLVVTGSSTCSMGVLMVTVVIAPPPHANHNLGQMNFSSVDVHGQRVLQTCITCCAFPLCPYLSRLAQHLCFPHSLGIVSLFPSCWRKLLRLACCLFFFV